MAAPHKRKYQASKPWTMQGEREREKTQKESKKALTGKRHGQHKGSSKSIPTGSVEKSNHRSNCLQ